ncbi:hypothetical protein [Plantactinospora mayteni]|uniref:hypothetical protein n=1 Tax=Plantactinospora mayteni TaxID=566021 RepID=UPI001940AE03|nr:hypothetical protein [Plantactinospora mayteni]
MSPEAGRGGAELSRCGQPGAGPNYARRRAADRPADEETNAQILARYAGGTDSETSRPRCTWLGVLRKWIKTVDDYAL